MSSIAAGFRAAIFRFLVGSRTGPLILRSCVFSRSMSRGQVFSKDATLRLVRVMRMRYAFHSCQIFVLVSQLLLLPRYFDRGDFACRSTQKQVNGHRLLLRCTASASSSFHVFCDDMMTFSKSRSGGGYGKLMDCLTVWVLGFVMFR